MKHYHIYYPKRFDKRSDMNGKSSKSNLSKLTIPPHPVLSSKKSNPFFMNGVSSGINTVTPPVMRAPFRIQSNALSPSAVKSPLLST